MTQHTHFDVLIIGSGIAGLSLALRLAPQGKNIGLISKAELLGSSSQYAQGGIAAVTESRDFASHIQDTLIAGAGLCDEATVAFTIEQAPHIIAWLIEQGVQFTKDPNNPSRFHLTREGGHKERRIYHVADSTGAAVIRTFTQNISQYDNIHCLIEHTAIDLLVADNICYGAQVLNRKNNQFEILSAQAVVLATGGASTVYLYTSNPNTSTGDGLAMAWRAGCRVANLEFNQFHPTSLYHPKADSFLISEAVRGEGGILCLPNGRRFMLDYDPRAELAPRDIVARAISFEMKKNKLDYVLLDISHKPAAELLQLFPMIAKRCRQFGFDITQEPIPVVPAAHYTCGGVITDHYARTDIKHLYAVGEVAYTGLHGANRIASNSLLECLVFAASAAQAIHQQLQNPAVTIPHFINLQPILLTQADITLIDQLTLQLRQLMSTHLGVIRSNAHLSAAHQQLQAILKQFQDITINESSIRHLSTGAIENPSEPYYSLKNRLMTASLMLRSAYLRQESRGCHYNLDFPTQSETNQLTILTPSQLKVTDF